MMFTSLRRYGLEYCDLPTMIENLSFLLKIWTVDIESKNTQRVPNFLYIVTFLTGACYFYVYVVSMLWFVFIRCRETKDMVAACVIFSIGACSLTGVAKLIYMRLYNDTIKDIVDEYLLCDALVAPGSRFSSNLHKALRIVKRRAMGFWLFLTINGFIYVTTPIILPGRHFLEDQYVIYGLEPMFETPNYQIAFIMMTAGVYFGIPPETNTTAFLTIFSGYAEAQMLALSDELNNLWEDANIYLLRMQKICTNKEADYEDRILNIYIQKQLRVIVEKHKMTIDLLSRIESIFQGIITVEFGFLISGLIAELLGGLESTYMQLPYTLIQVAMDCFVGQRLIDASLVLENAIYCCKWEYFNKSNQKTVYLMLMNSQKTLTLSVGRLTVLSFASLMSVLNSIYSTYAALRSRI